MRSDAMEVGIDRIAQRALLKFLGLAGGDIVRPSRFSGNAFKIDSK